jgi:sugar/nucleoside kinase (ribokinase family)
VDYFMPTVEEAALISGAADAESAAAFFAERRVGACVFKDGARGSLLAQGGALERVPAFQVSAVDTTGCGDAYCAGFVAGLAHGRSPSEACRTASATAAFNATALGTGEGVPAWDAVVEALGSLPLRAEGG